MTDTLLPVLKGVSTAVWNVLPEWIRSGLLFLGELTGKAWTTLWDFVRDPIGSIQAGLNWVTTTIGTAFDGALSTFGSWVEGALRGVAAALGTALQGMVTWLGTEIPKAVGVVVEFAKAHIVDPIIAGLHWLFARLTDIVRGLISTIEGLFAHHSPITPEQALPIGIGVLVAAVGAGALATGLADTLSTKVIGTGLELRSLGGFITAMINPSMFMGAVLGVIVGVGIKTPLTQFYNRSFRPSIPAIAEAQRMLWRGSINEGQFRDIVARWGYGDPYETGFVELTKELPGPGDLIRFVVREVIPPATFTEFMAYQGFSAVIAGWYWDAHWILPGRGEVIDAFHRGVISAAERDTYMVLHDYSSTPRPGIAVSDQHIVASIAKTLIPRVDLRYGWELGKISDAGLTERYKWLGYEDDSELMADIQKFRVLTAEYSALRRTYMGLYIDGRVTLEEFGAKLVELKTAPAAIPLWTERAEKERERRLKAPPEIEPKAITRAEAMWAYEHGLKDVAWLRTTLKAIDLSDDRIGLAVDISDKRIAERMKPPKEVTYRDLTTTQIRDLYRFEWLPKRNLPGAFEGIGYLPDDAEKLAAILVDLEAEKAAAEYDSEKRKLRDNAMKDFVKGYILKDVLRADLAEIGYPTEAIDYFVADALADRERSYKDKLIDYYEDAYVKDLVLDEALADYTGEVIVDKDALDLFLMRAYVRKYKKPKAG
uniref:Uncharacterized protein n=1 Tax=viral metagenome TaxID=1070528 RepID=A0A6H1ZYZ3_9ZZZZ